MVAQRSRLHLSYRLGVRAYLFATGRRGGRQRVAAAVGAAVDTAEWVALRRTDRLGFGPRLAADLADVGLCAVLAERDPEAATLVGVPLAMETGIRLGAIGFVVPAAHLAVTSGLRRWRGERTAATIFGWQAMAATMGMALSWYERREHDATVSRHRRELEAQRVAAWIAGQNGVAMGADTVVDELARVEYLLGAAEGDRSETGSGQALREWRASLASTTADRAVYLGTALARWSRSRQSAALADDVQIEIPPGEGTRVLSARQAAQLIEQLDRLDLSGAVMVRVEPTGSPPLPGDPVSLRVGHEAVVLRQDPSSILRPFDPAPLVVLAGGLWCLGLSREAHGGAPRTVTVPGALSTVPLAWWCHTNVRRPRSATAEQVVLALIAHGLAVALASTAALTAPYGTDGAQVFPATMTLLSASVLAGGCEQRLTKAARKRLLGAALVALAASLIPARHPIRWADLAVGALELGTVYTSFNRVQLELDRTAEELTVQLAHEADEARRDAYADGRRLVVDLVTKAAARARHRLASGPPDISRDIRDRAAERLDVVETMLEALS